MHSTWVSPLPLRLIPTSVSESFHDMADDETGLPFHQHPGTFGVVRRYDIHTGVDLYAPSGTPVYAVEDGIVVAIIPFTGTHAGSPWWHETWAVMVEGKSGVVLYGEITTETVVGDMVLAGDRIGTVIPVLKTDKGRPMSMLHLELYDTGHRDAVEWKLGEECPSGLRDPTPHLVNLSPKE